MEEFDVISIEVDRMEKLGMIQDPRYAEETPEMTKELSKKGKILKNKKHDEKMNYQES